MALPGASPWKRTLHSDLLCPFWASHHLLHTFRTTQPSPPVENRHSGRSVKDRARPWLRVRGDRDLQEARSQEMRGSAPCAASPASPVLTVWKSQEDSLPSGPRSLHREDEAVLLIRVSYGCVKLQDSFPQNRAMATRENWAARGKNI